MFISHGKIALVTFIVGWGSVSSVAHAQDLKDKYWLEAAAYWADVDSTVRINSARNQSIGTVIDFESDLALGDRKVLPSFSAGARVGSKIVIGADYYALKRTGTTSLARSIIVDDVTYPASAQIDSSFSSDVYRLTIGYAFVQNDQAEFGVAIGLHATDFEVSLEGQGQVGNASAQTEVRRRDVLAPLPTIGIFGAVEVAPQLTLSGRIDYLSLKIDDYKGKLINTQAELSYRVLKNVGIGAMYRYVDYDVEVDKDKWQGEVKYRFSGPALFVRIGF